MFPNDINLRVIDVLKAIYSLPPGARDLLFKLLRELGEVP